APGLVQQHGAGLDAADLAAGDGADVHAHQLVAQHFAALVGEHDVDPVLAEIDDAAAAVVEVVLLEQVAAHAGAYQAGVAHGRTHHQVALAGRGGQAAYVDDLAFGATQAIVLEADHVGQLLELVDHAQVLEERLDVRQRDRVDRL